ncbi:hypothetical protein BDP27DRAFT_1428595 [Rhodocollybia butyracea]|uniref:Uncharacterized protein n=1 Tax=Rhodocollybia butyracea TaxID=206335 RepID=A0A9P5PEC4_9AGAR|nr:hypothetical protein BDP27DRAFT_1428595 [Rhodocollybia butyracea]
MPIKKNFSIESANNARYVKTYDHSVGETSRLGSPTASFMTVASADLQRIRKDQGLLKSLADFLGPLAHVVEILDDPTACPMVQFPDTLICTANLSSSLPYASSPFLTSRLSMHPKTKSRPKKPTFLTTKGKSSQSVLNIAKLCKRLGIAADTGKSDGLTFSQFQDAAQNFYNFEAEHTEGHGQSLSVLLDLYTLAPLRLWTPVTPTGTITPLAPITPRALFHLRAPTTPLGTISPSAPIMPPGTHYALGHSLRPRALIMPSGTICLQALITLLGTNYALGTPTPCAPLRLRAPLRLWASSMPLSIFMPYAYLCIQLVGLIESDSA